MVVPSRSSCPPIKRVMNPQLDKWTGDFGNAYIRRSMLTADVVMKRCLTFRNIFYSFSHEPTSVLEVGCNIGSNLIALKPFIRPPHLLVGIEPNERARRIAQLGGVNVFPDCGQSINFNDDFFDMVFTCGVLIHCTLEEAEKVVNEMNRVSNRALMFMEYLCDEDKELPYRNDSNLLWKRPWPKHFKAWGLGEPLLSGYAGAEDGFDMINWWVYPKRRNHAV